MKKPAKLVTTKPKKVTVKFFINKVVLPVIDRKIKRYPLYMLITYDRKNTMMRCHYGQYYKDLKEIDKVHYPGLLAMEERIIQKTIRHELLQKKEEFDLKGINKKYDQYCIGVDGLLERYLKSQLWNVLSRLKPFEYIKAVNFESHDVEFNTLYKIAKKIYKDPPALLHKNFETEIEIYRTFMKVYQSSLFEYTFPVVIEWLDQSAIEGYTKRLREIYPSNSSMVNKSIDFINRVVQNFIKSQLF